MSTTPCANAKTLFSPAVDGRLEAGEKMIFDHHLLGCSSCQQEFESFRRLFSVVATLSSSRMPGPVPFPDTVSAFSGKSRQALPWWGRFGTTAAAAVLLTLVGIAAFQAGRDRNESGGDGQDVVEAENVDFVQPSEPVARQLKTWSQDIEGTGLLLEVADRLLPDARVQTIINNLLMDRERQSRHFLELGPRSLGSLEGTAKKIASNFVVVLSEMNRHADGEDDPARAIRWAKVRFQSRQMRKGCDQLNGMVRGFADIAGENFFVEKKDPVSREVSFAMRKLVGGNVRLSRLHLNKIKLILPNESSVPLQKLILCLESLTKPEKGRLPAGYDFGSTWLDSQGRLGQAHDLGVFFKIHVNVEGGPEGGVFRLQVPKLSRRPRQHMIQVWRRDQSKRITKEQKRLKRRLSGREL